MESIIIKMRSLYGEMGRGEKKIADYIFEHQKEIIGLSISELSAACGCGDATVVRFSRRLGLTGYQALKISIAQESGDNAPAGVQKDDSCAEIFRKHIGDIALALENTKSVLDDEMLTRAADTIMNARRIMIFGLGNSSSVAIDAQHKLLRAGLEAVAYCDNHMQAIAASHMRKGDVALGISHSGSSVDVVKALELAHTNGAATICITNYGSSPIVNCSDIALYTNAEETKYSILALSSRIAQLAILDSIYTYIVINSPHSVRKAIRDTEVALQDKKY